MGYGWNLIMYEHHAFLLEANVFKKDSATWISNENTINQNKR